MGAAASNLFMPHSFVCLTYAFTMIGNSYLRRRVENRKEKKLEELISLSRILFSLVVWLELVSVKRLVVKCKNV